MRKILIVGGMRRGGGITEFIITNYSKIETEELNFDFVNTIGLTDYEEYIKSKKWGLFYIRPLKKGPLKHYLDWYSFLKRNHKKYKAIHFHNESLHNFLPIIMAKLFRIENIIVHAHNTYNLKTGKFKHFFHKVGKKCVSRVGDYFFACSMNAGRFFFSKKAIKNDKVEVINNGIEIERFAFIEQERERIRASFNLRHQIVIGHVGRFEYQKNHEFIIEVFYEFHQYNQSSILMLVGMGPDEEKIKEKVKNLNLEKNVLFLGIRKDVNKIMEAMDVLLFPSIFEGLGIVLIEAQATGLPCLVSDIIAEEALCSPKIQTLSLALSAKEWAKKIQVLVTDDTERKNQHGLLREKGYSSNEVSMRLNDFYINL
ncbi:glycosyltransferase [Isobaculum melis]|uniref:Glycosyltransferase involved in cell wall bisynthesis n=1 Tax=Isobaculum melis TaxID=142588 RepID=A0A1H9SLW7_9LACT|nr:glycosyltransferase [Isobaculum melis]SER85878.1 Glycosyltransferase involved in cell wall bisynthesis [Isobaculum melis]